MTDIPIKIQFVKTLANLKPSRVIALKADGDTDFSLYVTDKSSIPFPLKKNNNGLTIQNTDGNLDITGTTTKTINISPDLIGVINSALQSRDNVSELTNDAGYIEEAPINGNEYTRKDGNWEEKSTIISTLDQVANAGHISTKGIVINEINRIGVNAESFDNVAVQGFSTNQYGVFGTSNENVGVQGFSENNAGVVGNSLTETAIQAVTATGNNSNIFEALNDFFLKAAIDKDGFFIGAGFKTPTGTDQDMLMADGTVKNLKIFEDNTSVTVTPPVAGVTTVLKVITIPGDFFEDGGLYEFNSFLTCDTIAAIVYINSAPTIDAGAKIFIKGNIATNNVNNHFNGFLKLTGNSLKLYNNQVFANQLTENDIDFTVNTANLNYFIIALQNPLLLNYTYNFSILKKLN